MIPRHLLVRAVCRAFDLEAPTATVERLSDRRLATLAEQGALVPHGADRRRCACWWCTTWRRLAEEWGACPICGLDHVDGSMPHMLDDGTAPKWPYPEVEALATIERLLGREAREALEAATPEELTELLQKGKK